MRRQPLFLLGALALARNVVRSELAEALGKAVFSAKTGELRGPVETPFGAYVFEVRHVTAARVPLSAAKQASIAQEIVLAREEKAISKFGLHYRNRMISVTRCAPGFVVESCSEYVKPTTPAVK